MLNIGSDRLFLDRIKFGDRIVFWRRVRSDQIVFWRRIGSDRIGFWRRIGSDRIGLNFVNPWLCGHLLFWSLAFLNWSTSRPRSRKMPLSQSCSHRNSVQNAPIESFPALTATTFVNISTFVSRGTFSDPDPKNPHCHKVVRTEILCRMGRLINSQLSRRLFS